MFCLDDTICAIASSPGPRTIIRVSGPQAIQICQGLVAARIEPARQVKKADLAIGSEFTIEAWLYVFPGASSYTGQPTVEIHIEACQPIVSLVLERLADAGARPAQPGEFTARAFLLGKMDLESAEAVNQLITASSNIKRAAAMKMLQARGASLLESARSGLLDAAALVEASLDFPDEQLESLSRQQIVESLQAVIAQLSKALELSASQQRLSVMPSVGLAGLPNAGKSTLFNRLCKANSIVSAIPGTTRDVLEAVLDLRYHQCLVFDCPGLDVTGEQVLDQLVYQAATETISRADAVLFCVDVTKSDYRPDLQILMQICRKAVIYVATKADLLDKAEIDERLARLKGLFQADFIAVSGKTGLNMPLLANAIEQSLWPDGAPAELSAEYIALSTSAQQATNHAIEAIRQAIDMILLADDELAAVQIRSAYQALAEGESPIDQQILDRIFSRFCIGK